MHELDRRSMLKVVAALSLGPYSALANEKESTLHFVAAGTDRTGQQRGSPYTQGELSRGCKLKSNPISRYISRRAA